jgi:hypothetical protein
MDELKLKKIKRQAYLDRNKKYVYIFFFLFIGLYFFYQNLVSNNFVIQNKSKEPIQVSVKVFSPHSKKTKVTRLFEGRVIRPGKSLSTRFYLDLLPSGNKCVSIIIYGLKTHKNKRYSCIHQNIDHY